MIFRARIASGTRARGLVAADSHGLQTHLSTPTALAKWARESIALTQTDARNVSRAKHNCMHVENIARQ